MEANISKFFDSVGSFFSGADNIPWCDGDIIAVIILTTEESGNFLKEVSQIRAQGIFQSTYGFRYGGRKAWNPQHPHGYETKYLVLSFGKSGGKETIKYFARRRGSGKKSSRIFCCHYAAGVINRSFQFFFFISLDVPLGCEREVVEGGAENNNESLMRLSWALVHSRQPENVNRGIAMLEASLDGSSSPLQMREKLYLLAVGHYRSGDYSKSRQLLEQCLEIAPDWRQAQALKKTVEDRVAKDGVIGIGIAAAAVGLLVGGIAAAVVRKK